MEKGKTREETIADLIKKIQELDDRRLFLLDACVKGLTNK